MPFQNASNIKKTEFPTYYSTAKRHGCHFLFYSTSLLTKIIEAIKPLRVYMLTGGFKVKLVVLVVGKQVIKMF